jgi:hypothetical protein
MKRMLPGLTALALCLAGCSAPAKAKDAPGNASTPGRDIYIAKCAKCHKFHDPAKYSNDEWQLWMQKMVKKAKLKPEQTLMLSRYIEENLRTPRGTRDE